MTYKSEPNQSICGLFFSSPVSLTLFLLKSVCLTWAVLSPLSAAGRLYSKSRGKLWTGANCALRQS